MEKSTSMIYWYPLIEGKLPTPKTKIIELEGEDLHLLFSMLDGDGFAKDLCERIKAAGAEFTYPIFMRTDLTSGKHSFLQTCYVKGPEEIPQRMYYLFEDTIMKDINIGAFVLREYLNLESSFKAFDHLPIAKERRYFVEDGKVLCHHPYWPEDAIQFYNKTKAPSNWLVLLKKLNIETESEIKQLSRLAERFSDLVPGAWSVDFACCRDGGWIFIDAAEAHRSWHPSDCKIAFPENGDA